MARDVDEPVQSGVDRWVLAELFALTGLAIAHPLLDLTGRSPDMFLFRRADRLDILRLVAGVVLLPALCILVVEELAGLVSGTLRRLLHLAAVTGLLTVLAVEALGLLPAQPVVHLDAGYDYQPCRQLLAERELVGEIATRGLPAPIQAGRRWVIERTHAWANQYGKLSWCTERWRLVVEFWLALAGTVIVVAGSSVAPGPTTAGTADPAAGRDHHGPTLPSRPDLASSPLQGSPTPSAGSVRPVTTW